MKYIDKEVIRIGDVFTDGSLDREEVRLQVKAKVLYVDKFNLVWFPLNDYTANLVPRKEKYSSYFSCFFSEIKKVNLSELTKNELSVYNNTNDYLEEK